MLTFLGLADAKKPKWIVWENVPGVLSSNGGKDFGSFLGALGELGYEWAYRVLDAQWFGVAQRRRRVFVVAHLGEGSLAAKVLFESESVRRDTPPSREARQGVATNVEAGVGVSPTVIIDRAAFNQGENAQYKPHIEHSETMDSLVARGPHAVAFQTSELRLTGKLTEKSVCPTLKANTKAGDTEVKVVLYENHPNDSRVTGPHDVAPSCVSRYGTGGGNVPLVQEGVDLYNQALTGDVHCPLRTAGGHGAPAALVQEAVAVDTYNHALQEKAVPIRSTASDICHTGGVINPADRMAVRRLTPRECERLQGFPDDHTLIPWRNKPADQCPDGPRYKALGNSMAVPCMAWIGKRIDAVEKTK